MCSCVETSIKEVDYFTLTGRQISIIFFLTRTWNRNYISEHLIHLLIFLFQMIDAWTLTSCALDGQKEGNAGKINPTWRKCAPDHVPSAFQQIVSPHSEYKYILICYNVNNVNRNTKSITVLKVLTFECSCSGCIYSVYSTISDHHRFNFSFVWNWHSNHKCNN